jgi:hypothetical protein
VSHVKAARGKAFAWLCHPVTVTALALLMVNDHVLKSVWPGWVTGKLSDVAGMVLAPPLLAALAGLVAPRLAFRRVAVAAIVAVGCGFAFIKLWGYGAELASAAWSLLTPSLVRADPTDLLALPFLGVAWWTARRPLTGLPARRWLRAVRLAVILPAALFGVAATSATPTPDAFVVVVEGDALYLGATSGQGPVWSVSHDGGRTFVDTEPLPAWQPGASPGPSASGPVPSASADVSDCARSVPVVCYRVAGERRIAVESRTGDGPWQEDWSLSETQWKALKEGYAYEDSTRIESEALAVLDVSGGHVVVVANGRDGFAVRDEAGSWRRIGFPAIPDDEAPLALPDPDSPAMKDDTPGAAALAVGVFLGGLALTCVGTWRAVRSGRRGAWSLLPAPYLVIVLCMPTSVFAWGNSPTLAGFVAPVAMVLSLVPAVIALAVARTPLASAALAGLLIVGVLGVAYLIWLRTGRGDPWMLVLCMIAGAVVMTPGVAQIAGRPYRPGDSRV